MRVSEACVNGSYRRLRKCRSLASSLDRRLQYALKHRPELVDRDCVVEAIRLLDEAATSILAGDKINTSISSRFLDRSVEDVMAEFFGGIAPPKGQLDEVEAALCAHMSSVARVSRVASARVALSLALGYHCARGAFVFFNTLTVSDDWMSEVFSVGSDLWQRYLRRWGDAHPYLGVVEAGGKTGRLHIHVVHMLDRLPEGCMDPNYGLRVPNRREVASVKLFWEHGFSCPIAVRFSPVDAFGKIGWRWPFDARTEKELVVKPPVALASYLSKYLTSSVQSAKRSSYQWRMRKSHRLGCEIIDEILNPLSLRDLLTVSELTDPGMRIDRLTVPPSMVRKQSCRLLSRKLTPTEYCLTASEYDALPSPLRSWRASGQSGTGSSPLSALPLFTPDAEGAAHYDVRARIRESARRAGERYFGSSDLAGRGWSSDYI